MKPDLSVWLGRRVRVVVDRPLGCAHPRHPDPIYPVNAGELPGTVSGDGLPIDVYLLGWEIPLTEAIGQVVAVLVRADDDEDQLAVVREGTRWDDGEILAATAFREQCFQPPFTAFPKHSP
ncbi:inorganic pyrophosphatase-related protein [Deinococcus gobiensis I-0]|uniref:Inorganic pyrophosphatase-related protein n=1 Tax=Deinococcus gobiensis (strain DSM 21396 / JCM 16679 / CGMCC 1.7299 / I-0) TaxID=745776 RepID=H8GY54_DEIGI|nr:inorganic pyrophosphatase-related protein [Deinococcus gobiensis I-0]